MKLEAAVEVCQAQEKGQDRAASFRYGGGTLYVLADGAGGTGSGGQAADLALEVACAFSKGEFGTLATALLELDRKVSALGGRTTVVIVTVVAGLIRGIIAGDSVAWLVDRGTVRDLSMGQGRRPMVGDGAVGVEFGPIELTGTLLLASDGLTNYVSAARIRELLAASSLQGCAAALIESARLKNGSLQDDVAVVVARAVDADHEQAP